MKITITKQQLAQVRSRRDAVKDMLEEHLRSDSTANTLFQRKESLESELADLEKSSPDDKEAIEKIAQKRIERDLVHGKITALPSKAGSPDRTGALSEELRHLTAEIHQALVPSYEAAVAKISESIRPFCLNDANARNVARQTDAARDVARTLFPRWGESAPPLMQAPEAIKFCNSILSGEIAVKFDSQIS
jgi:chromosome segregation ATPase